MEYKGYRAEVRYSIDDGLFLGHVAGIRDMVQFQSETEDALPAAFREAVYLDFCQQLGELPEVPASQERR